MAVPLHGSQLQANPVATHLRMSRRESALAISGGHLRCLFDENSGENHALPRDSPKMRSQPRPVSAIDVARAPTLTTHPGLRFPARWMSS